MTVIDLSLPIVHGMPVYQGDPPVIVRPLHHLKTHGWRLTYVCIGTHTGTHVNAPSHMAEDGATVTELAPERFMGKARYLAKRGRLPRGVGLLLAGAAAAIPAARIIAANPPFVGYVAGFDVALDTERELLAAGIPVFENLVNLDKLPEKSAFTFIGLPMPLAHADGSPVRAVALVR